MQNFYNKFTYNDAVKLLTSSGKFRISLGLERISNILNLLGNPQDKLEFIHVAGTNGKGSVCSIISSILSSYGKKIGLYTSPHLVKYNERIKILSNETTCISDDDFSKYIFEISNLAKANDIDLTEFEILTAVMFQYFYDNKVEIVVLETGLGGRYDATNVIKKHLCSVITHVDFDHMERLGNTIEEIAFEKAGIMKRNSPCVIFEGREVYYDVANDVGALLKLVVPQCGLNFQMFEENLALKGVNQKENLSLALAVVETVFPEIPNEVIINGLRNVRHPARFQYIEEKNLIIDGAHNPNGVLSLLTNLDYYHYGEKRRFIFGCLKNKEYEKMMKILFKKDDLVYFYHFNHNNSATFEDLNKVSPVKAQELKKDTKIDFNDGYLNIICGSLYMINELCQHFKIEFI